MNKKIKCFLSISLSLTLVLFPCETLHSINLIKNNSVAASEINSKCGDNLTWSIVDNILTFSGYGDMYNYSVDNPAPWKNKNYTEVSFSPEMTSIGDFAFYNSPIEKIDWCGKKSQLTKIGDMAFACSENLTYIRTPYVNSVNAEKNKAITTIGDYAFFNCTKLEHIDLYHGLENLGAGAFKNCISLEYADLPQQLKTLKRETFYNCKSLPKAEIDFVKYIEDNVFQGCSSLKKVDLSEKVKKIGENCFANCTSLSDVKLSSQLSEIPYKAFYNCENLTKIDIPYSTIKISEKAFEDCSKLSDIHFSNNLRSIGDFAFAGCESLGNVFFNNNISHVGNGAFNGSGICIDITRNLYVQDYAEKNNVSYCWVYAEDDYSFHNPSRLTIYGDLSRDSIVDITDLSLLSLHILGDYSISDEILVLGDINLDYKIDILDLAYLKMYISYISKDVVHIENNEIIVPDKVCETVLNSILNNTKQQKSHYIKADGTLGKLGSNGEMAEEIMKNIKYRINNIEQADNIAIANIEFSYPDVNELYDRIYSKGGNITNDDIKRLLKSYFSNKNFNMIDKTTDLLMIKIDNEWYLIESDDLNDVLTGGIYSKYVEQTLKIAEQFK